MTEEIKEILDYIDDRIIPNEKWDKIKDYITNLQQENEKLKDDNITLVKNQIKCNSDYFRIVKENEKEKQFIKDCGFQNQQQLVLSYLDYKSRCEKAIEYIDEHTLFVNGGIIKSILNGSDENE